MWVCSQCWERSDRTLPLHEIVICVEYISLALIYVLYQFRFMIAHHVRYLTTRVATRLREVGNSEDGLWETWFARTLKKTPFSVKGPVKFGVLVIPCIVIGMCLLLNLCSLADCVRDFQADSSRLAFGLGACWFLAIGVIIPTLLLGWLLCGFSHLSKIERR
jgi:hypothetical protein